MTGFRIFILIIFTWCVFPFYGNDDIDWLYTQYDFGTFRESSGIRKCEFKFVNRGRKKVEIQDVKVACGCTSVEFTKGKIARGDTAVISVAYDPEERPGLFDKGIYVYFKNAPFPERLKISGNVVASPQTLAFLYPHREGNLYFDTLEVNFGEVGRGVKKREFVDIYNGGMEDISPDFTVDNEGISLEITPETLKPGEKGSITVYLDPTRQTFSGKRKWVITGNWSKDNKVEIPVEADINP